MSSARVLLFLIFAMTLGVSYLAVPVTPLPPQQITAPALVAPRVNLDKLERARRASFDVVLVDYKGSSGSAILVSRIKLENGNYQYRALTNYHVLDDMLDAVTEDKLKASRKLELTFQPEFHGQPLRFHVEANDDWAIPEWDWASFTFESKHWLECVEVATKEDFESVKPFEHIYAIACGGSYGQQLREGVISVTHNVATKQELRDARVYPWQRYPNDYFRPSFPIWYGDSGGPVFNKDGKLIGLITAFTTIRIVTDDPMPVFHHGVAIKAHIIREHVKHSPDFLKVEN